MTPTLDAFLKRLARLAAETDWAIEQARGRLWATQAHKGLLHSGSTLRLYAAIICEKTRDLARVLSADIARLHPEHQSEAYDALHTCVVQLSLKAQSSDRVKSIGDSTDATRQFRLLVRDGVKVTVGLIRDSQEGFDVDL